MLVLIITASCASPRDAEVDRLAAASAAADRTLTTEGTRHQRPAAPPTPPASRGDSASLDVLRTALASPNWEDRLIAVEAVGASRRPELAAALEDALGDPEEDIRLAAVEALGQLGGAVARRKLESVRDDTTEVLSIRALAAGELLNP